MARQEPYSTSSLKTPTSGGSFMGNFTPSLNRGWGQYWTSVKVNTSKSEFSYSGWFAPRWNLEMGRSNTERYELADGSRYVRTEQSQKGSGFEAWHNGHTLNYNFLDPQKQTFNASLNFNNNNYKNKYKGILTDERRRNRKQHVRPHGIHIFTSFAQPLLPK